MDDWNCGDVSVFMEFWLERDSSLSEEERREVQKKIREHFGGKREDDDAIAGRVLAGAAKDPDDGVLECLGINCPIDRAKLKLHINDAMLVANEASRIAGSKRTWLYRVPVVNMIFDLVGDGTPPPKEDLVSLLSTQALLAALLITVVMTMPTDSHSPRSKTRALDSSPTTRLTPGSRAHTRGHRMA